MPKAKRGAKRKEIDVAVALAAGAAAADAKAEIRAKTAAGINCQREEWVCAACASAPMQLSCKPIHLAGKKHRKQMMKQGADRSAAKAAAEANRRHTKKAETPEQRARRIVMSIPKAKDELYAMKVDWDTLEAADVYSTKMVPFVTKKVMEYFGEPDETVINFVVEELTSRRGAVELVENLGSILENDCEDFVFKLWRLLMFEMLSAQDIAGAGGSTVASVTLAASTQPQSPISVAEIVAVASEFIGQCREQEGHDARVSKFPQWLWAHKPQFKASLEAGMAVDNTKRAAKKACPLAKTPRFEHLGRGAHFRDFCLRNGLDLGQGMNTKHLAAWSAWVRDHAGAMAGAGVPVAVLEEVLQLAVAEGQRASCLRLGGAVAETVAIEAEFTEAKLGIVFVKNSTPPCIKVLKDPSKYPTLRTGLLLLSVGAQSITSLDYAAALSLIRDSARPLTLTFSPPSDVLDHPKPPGWRQGDTNVS